MPGGPPQVSATQSTEREAGPEASFVQGLEAGRPLAEDWTLELSDLLFQICSFVSICHCLSSYFVTTPASWSISVL